MPFLTIQSHQLILAQGSRQGQAPLVRHLKVLQLEALRLEPIQINDINWLRALNLPGHLVDIVTDAYIACIINQIIPLNHFFYLRRFKLIDLMIQHLQLIYLITNDSVLFFYQFSHYFEF